MAHAYEESAWGPQGGQRSTDDATRLSCQGRFPLLVTQVHINAKVLTHGTSDPRLCPVRASDPGPSPLLSEHLQ